MGAHPGRVTGMTYPGCGERLTPAAGRPQRSSAACRESAGCGNAAGAGKAGLREGECDPRRAGLGPGRAPSGRRCRNRGAEGVDGPGTPPRLALPVPLVPSRPVPSWRWSGRAPAPPATCSGLPRPRLLLARRSRRGCERSRDRRNLTWKYSRSECLWILEQNWEFIWKKCCDYSQTLLQTDFNCCIIFC